MSTLIREFNKSATQPINHCSISVEQFHQMIEDGLFEGRRVELIEGEVIEMSPEGSEHSFGIDILMRAIWHDVEAKNCLIRIQHMLTLSLAKKIEVEPDLCIVKNKKGQYRRANPTPVDVILVVEVARRSRAYDMKFKAQLYASFNIPEYWVIDVKKECVYVHRDPDAGAYREIVSKSGKEILSPKALRQIRVSVSQLFPTE
ncbi:Uma2 family endonuclease [soil metagenome]